MAHAVFVDFLWCQPDFCKHKQMSSTRVIFISSVRAAPASAGEMILQRDGCEAYGQPLYYAVGRDQKLMEFGKP